MGFFENFPYTNYQSGNWDWVLKLLKRMEEALDDSFRTYITEWVMQNYNKLFFDAAYNPNTDTLTMSLAEFLAAKTGESPVSYIDLAGSVLEIVDKAARSGISDLQKDVSRIDTDISGIKTRLSGIDTSISGLTTKVNGLQTETKDVLSFNNIVYIGDSYLDGYLLPSPSTQNWGAVFTNIVKPSYKYYMSNGGGGFCNRGNSSGKNAADYLQAKAPEIQNKDNITAVICCLGFNDRGYTGDEITPKADQFWNLCNSIFPNAKKIFFVNPSFGSLDSNKIAAMCRSASSKGAIVIDSWWWLLFNSSQFSSDYIHPNQSGQNLIARYLYTCLHGGRPQTSAYYKLPASNGFINNIIAKNDDILLFIEGEYSWNEPFKQVASWGDKIFITQGVGWKGAANAYRDMVPFTEGDSAWVFGFVQWYRNDNPIYVSSMANINSPSTYSKGPVSFYRPLHQTMLFG